MERLRRRWDLRRRRSSSRVDKGEDYWQRQDGNDIGVIDIVIVL